MGRPRGSKNAPGHSAGRPRLTEDEPSERQHRNHACVVVALR